MGWERERRRWKEYMRVSWNMGRMVKGEEGEEGKGKRREKEKKENKKRKQNKIFI